MWNDLNKRKQKVWEDISIVSFRFREHQKCSRAKRFSWYDAVETVRGEPGQKQLEDISDSSFWNSSLV